MSITFNDIVNASTKLYQERVNIMAQVGLTANVQLLARGGIVSDNNPFPVANYIKTAGGIFIPQKGSDEGEAFMKLMGSNALVGALATVVTAGTRVQLPDIPCQRVIVIAEDDNLGVVYAGGNDVSSSTYGVKLYAEDVFPFDVSNANLIYIDASLDGEGISYVVL